jgi:hypothetical protein
MQTLSDNLTSIQWWLGVVFVGIFINLLSIFIKNKYDGYFSRISSWWRNKSEKRKREFEDDVNILKNSPQELVMASFLELRLINKSIFLMLSSIFLFILGMTCMCLIASKTLLPGINIIILVFVYLVATITMILACLCHQRSLIIAEKIMTARK